MRFGKLIGGFRVGVAGAVLAVAVAGCSEPTPTGKLPDTPSSTATSTAASSAAPTSAAPTTTYTPEEQAVIDQYKGYYNTLDSVESLDAGVLREAFAPFIQPNAMDALIATFQPMAQAGEMPTGHVVFGIVSVSIADGTATVNECRDTSTESITRTSDGAVISQGAPGTKIEAKLAFNEEQRWQFVSPTSNRIRMLTRTWLASGERDFPLRSPNRARSVPITGRRTADDVEEHREMTSRGKPALARDQGVSETRRLLKLP